MPPQIPPPPMYNTPAHAPPLPSSSRPAPAPVEPVTYSSLSDLTKNRAARPPPPPPAPTQGRQFNSGYGQDPYAAVAADSGAGAGAGAAAGGRRVPPPPARSRPDTSEPPRRNVDAYEPGRPAGTGAAGASQSYLATAQSYVPKSVSSGVNSAGQTARDGFDSVFNQQRKDQVLSGAGTAAAGAAKGAAKLMGKAAWQIGKFASR